MTTRLGRNDQCPCGSGLKYKKCCYEKERTAQSRERDERVAVEIALAFLRDNFPDEVDDAIDLDFLGCLDDDEFDSVAGWPDDLQAELEINMGEWLLADAVLRFEEESIPALDLVLGPDGPLLPEHSREWLLSLGDRGLSLFEVRNVQAGEGFEIGDLVNTDDTPVRLLDPAGSETARPGDVFGARLVRKGEVWILSGAFYPMTRDEADDCLEEIVTGRETGKSGAEDSPDLTGPIIIDHWLRNMIREQSASETVEAPTKR